MEEPFAAGQANVAEPHALCDTVLCDTGVCSELDQVSNLVLSMVHTSPINSLAAPSNTGRILIRIFYGDYLFWPKFPMWLRSLLLTFFLFLANHLEMHRNATENLPALALPEITIFHFCQLQL